MQGKKQALRVESLAALENMIRSTLHTLGLMPTSYSEVLNPFSHLTLIFISFLAD